MLVKRWTNSRSSLTSGRTHRKGPHLRMGPFSFPSSSAAPSHAASSSLALGRSAAGFDLRLSCCGSFYPFLLSSWRPGLRPSRAISLRSTEPVVSAHSGDARWRDPMSGSVHQIFCRVPSRCDVTLRAKARRVASCLTFSLERANDTLHTSPTGRPTFLLSTTLRSSLRRRNSLRKAS